MTEARPMTDIPADIERAARDALGEKWSAELGGTKGWIARRNSIARAILAEREACANQVRSYRLCVEDSEDLETLEGCIRSPEESGGFV